MIPEDAIWILELIRNRDARTEAEKDAVNAAIEALKAQLSQEGTTSDLISRQATIDALDTAIEHYDGIAEECRKKADIERNDYMDMRDDAYEARQLAQWLNELKYLRKKIEQLTIQPEERTEKRMETHACDLISRQAAIDLWDKYHPYIAIKAAAYDRELRALPSVQPEPSTNCSEIPNSSDTISRQAAVDALSMMQGIVAENGVRKGISMAWQQIEDLPPAQPERAAGEWIVHLYKVGVSRYECVTCHARCDIIYPYCPYCGEKKEGERNAFN